MPPTTRGDKDKDKKEKKAKEGKKKKPHHYCQRPQAQGEAREGGEIPPLPRRPVAQEMSAERRRIRVSLPRHA